MEERLTTGCGRENWGNASDDDVFFRHPKRRIWAGGGEKAGDGGGGGGGGGHQRSVAEVVLVRWVKRAGPVVVP